MTDKIPSIRIKTSKNKTICQKKRTYREIGTRFALPSSEVENRLKTTKQETNNKKGV